MTSSHKKDAERLVVKVQYQHESHSKLKYIQDYRQKVGLINDASKEKSFQSFVELVCIFEKVNQVEFEDQQDIDPFQDEALLQSAMDYCLSIKSLLCTKYILDRLREDKIEPVVGIKALSEVIQGISSLQDLSESSHSMTKLEGSDECVNILKTLIEKKNCTLRYGDNNEGVSDMLRSIYHRLGQNAIQIDSERKYNSKKSMKENFESDRINDSKSEEGFSFNIEDTDQNHKESVKLNYYSHHKKFGGQSFHEIPPELNTKKLLRMDTLRVKKIQQIISDEYNIPGVKFFDLHLLNMKNSQVFELCTLMYSGQDLFCAKTESIFPIPVYKLMLFYEELEAFQLMFNQELYFASKIKIIAESLSYSLIISNPMIAVFIANMYPDELFHNKAVAIDTILHYLKEFTENNGGSRYRRVKHLEQYLFIVERMLCFFNFAQAKKLIEIFNDFIDIGQNKEKNGSDRVCDEFQNNFLVYSQTPIKECVLIMFICYKLKSSYKELHKGYQELEDKYSQIVNLLLDATEDISQVELILTAKCFNRKEVIDLISECDFQLVLNNDKVSRVVTDFWKGPYETEFFMNNCYAYAQIRELFIDSKKFFGYKPAGEYAFSIDRLWRQKSQKKIFEENEKSKNKARYANNFQFEQWDKSLSTKYFIETLFIIIGSTIVSINSSYTLELSIEAQPSATTVLGIVSQLESDGLSESTRQSLINQVESIANEAEERLEKFFRSIDINIMINWILATYILKLISEYIFVKIRSKSFSFMATDIVLNIIYFVTLTWMTCLLHFDYYQHAPRSDEYYYVRVYQYATTHMQDVGTQVCFAILLMVHTIRVLNILRASQTFGPMIEIIFSMIIELFKFMVIFQCIILIFTSSMRILFFTLPEFSSRTETYVTLYSASLSNFDFSIFQSELMSVNKLYGYCFMGLFLLVSAIALLNFLIAVISHVYEKLNQIKVGLYLKSLIGIRQVMQHDDRYSCLVSSVPPLNIVPFIMTPAVLWMQSKKLNYCILHYEYLVVAIVGMTLYILFAIICIPFAYVLIIGTLLKTMCGKKRSEKSKCTQITDLFLFIIFGFIMLICRTICDFGLFICDLYNTNLIKCTDIESTSVNTRSTITGEVDKNFYLLFLLFLKQYPSKKVHSKKLIADLRSLLDIHQHLRTIIFSGKEANQLFKSNK
ncbi:unnamed protein product [Moneuplotes crassus]|uniref:Ion transport domain-containing protein n=1 Tax=Euplotes crassus TaxID=5936 RepID=A0AAD1UTQ9_EUPCR|nr:unnamed protein product [Moneuplotes crassus]